MIYFTRAGTTVKCIAHVDVPNYEKTSLYFYWETGSNISAGLLSAEMEKQLSAKLETIRRESYEAGWRDAKAKKEKRKYFNLGWFTRG